MVPPDNQENVLEVFRINTCLWGGQYNPIIPVRKDKNGCLSEKEKQFVNNLLDFFEPDLIVEVGVKISNDIEFDSDRICGMNNFNDRREFHPFPQTQYGQSVEKIYALYKQNFNSLDKHNYIHVKTTQDYLKTFLACVFGDFPEEENLKHLEKSYINTFKPTIKTLTASDLNEIYNTEHTSALGAGCKDIDLDGLEIFPTHRLFILDEKNTEDLIDFWNWRGVHPNIKAVPVGWIKELSPSLRNFIRKHSFPPVEILSRSIHEKTIQQLYKDYIQHISNTQENPKLDKSENLIKTSSLRIIQVTSKKIEKEVSEKKPVITFDYLSEGDGEGSFLYANVIKLRSSNNQIATAFPTDYRKNFIDLNLIEKSNNRMYLSESEIPRLLLSTKEGLVVFSHDTDSSDKWTLMDGSTAIKYWLQSNSNVKTAQLSDAGRIPKQIIQSLGFDGISVLANEAVVKLLNKISKSRLKSIHFQKFQNEINKAVKMYPESNHLSKILIEKKVVELGMEIRCDKCNQWSWYSLTKLDYSLICDFCLKVYSFPTINPTHTDHSKWAYRVVGPFALPKYAEGGYAVALSIHFFTDVIGKDNTKVTWSTGQELELSVADTEESTNTPSEKPSIKTKEKRVLNHLPDGSTDKQGKANNKKLEVDFILWNQKRISTLLSNSSTDIIFGEAKSFRKELTGAVFQIKEINNMKQLAETFPGSLLVFATMSESDRMTMGEEEELRKLAEWGREYNKKKQKARAPVIILTKTELFAGSSLSKAWEKESKELKKEGESLIEKYKKESSPSIMKQFIDGWKTYGKEHKELIQHIDNWNIPPRHLAYYTQYLYLDMPLKFPNKGEDIEFINAPNIKS